MGQISRLKNFCVQISKKLGENDFYIETEFASSNISLYTVRKDSYHKIVLFACPIQESELYYTDICIVR